MERRIKGVLSPKASGSITITENGNYDVVDVANAVVDVRPSGTIEITENGEHDVSEYEKANVNVADKSKAIFLNFIRRTLTEFSNDELTYIGKYSFSYMEELIYLSLPNLERVDSYALSECSSLTNVRFQNLTMTSNSFLRRCVKLESVDFYKVAVIGTYTFYQCTSLKTLIIRTSSLCSLNGTNALTQTKIASGEGYIYVPSNLVNVYKSATNWSTYADQFRALEDYTIDGTTTGDLDESKIG